MAHEEYLRRNLLVAKAEGAKAAVSVALKRLEMQTRPPRWLVKSLNATLVRLDPLPHDLAMWRDMALDAPEFARQGKETAVATEPKFYKLKCHTCEKEFYSAMPASIGVAHCSRECAV